MTDEKSRLKLTAKITYRDDLVPRKSDVFIINTKNPRVIEEEYPFNGTKKQLSITITDDEIRVKEPNGSLHYMDRKAVEDPIIITVAIVLDNLIYVNLVTKTSPNSPQFLKFLTRIEEVKKREEIKRAVELLR